MRIKFPGVLLIAIVILLLASGCFDPGLKHMNDTAGSSLIQETDSNPGFFSKQSVDYFSEIALGAEFGDNRGKARKWTKNPVNIHIYGNPDQAARACLDSVIDDFNHLSTTSKLVVDETMDADIEIYFVPVSEFPLIEPNYVQGNWGFFGCMIDSNCEIYHARILIGTDLPTPRERCHLIREELTQSLGLARDSWKYQDSIFYGGWSEMNSYSKLDEDLIRIMYATNLPPCATADDVCSYIGCAG